MDYKECTICGDYLPYTDFYFKTNERTGKRIFNSSQCKECYREREREERLEQKEKKGTGSERVLVEPNKYADELQKQQTFNFLTALGWKYNEVKGIWYDDIKKTKDGEYIGVWTPTDKKKAYVTALQFPVKYSKQNPPILFISKFHNKKAVSVEKIHDVLYAYFVDGLTREEIVEQYNVSRTSVSTYIRKLYEQVTGINITNTNITLTKEKKIVTKKYFKSTTTPDDIPTINLVHQHLKNVFTPEVIREIQMDYYQNGLKFREVGEKYKEYGQGVAEYIIRKTMYILKHKRDNK